MVTDVPMAKAWAPRTAAWLIVAWTAPMAKTVREKSNTRNRNLRRNRLMATRTKVANDGACLETGEEVHCWTDWD